MMSNSIRRLAILLAAITTLFSQPSITTRTSAERKPSPLREADPATRHRVLESYGKLPLSFEINRGQAKEDVRFLSRGAGYSLSLKSNEAALTVRNGGKSATVSLKFTGANPSPEVEGIEEQSGRSNYLIGADPSKWRSGIAHYAKVRYRELYRGIDAVFYGNQRQLEYDFIVAPGADPRAIELSFEGAERVRLDRNGDLLLRTAGGDVRQRKPAIYQEAKGVRKVVKGSYIFRTSQSEIRNPRVGFKIGNYDRRLPLVIDPVLVYSTYFGGSFGESAGGIAVDKDGNVYVIGSTASPDFPTVNSQYGFQSRSSFYRSVNGADSWSAGLTPRQGLSVISLAVDPRTPSTIYAGTDEGLYKSLDGGETWVEKNAGLRKEWTSRIVFDPAAPATLYALVESQIFKSVNGGDGWTELPGVRNVTAFAIDPKTPSTLYAAGYADGSASLYKSVNGGGNWNLLAANLTTTEIGSLAIDPQTPTTLYFGSRGRGVFKSVNGGADWAAINSGISDRDIRSLAMDPRNPRTLYASGTKLFKTTDGGANWTEVSALFIESLIFDPTDSSTIYGNFVGRVVKSTDGGVNWDAKNSGLVSGDVYALAIDPSNPSRLYLGVYRASGTEVFVSKMNAAGTALIYSTFIGGDGADFGSRIAVDPEGNAIVSGGSDSLDFPTVNPIQGSWQKILFKSLDGGDNWSPNGALPREGTITIDPVNTSTLYVLGYGNRVFKSTDEGKFWKLGSKGLPDYDPPADIGRQGVLIDPANPSTLYVPVETVDLKGAIYKSADGGANWSDSSKGLVCRKIVTLLIDPANPSTLYAGTEREPLYRRGGGGIFKSTDGGANWSQMSSGLPDDEIGGKSEVTALALDPRSPSTLYAGVNGKGIFKSADGGATWVIISSLDPGFFKQTLIVDPTNPSILYAGTYRGFIYKSADGGVTWNQLSAGFPDFILLGGPVLAMNPANSSVLYAGLYVREEFPKFYRSVDAGASWKPSNNGLGLRQLRSLAIDPRRPGTLYAVTRGAASISGSNTGGFVAKLNAAGSALVYSTFVDARINDLAVDAAGNAYLAGSTPSDAFPVTSGAFQKSYKGGTDSIVMKLDGAGALSYATFLGGSRDDAALGIAVDADGAAYVAGTSDSIDFPATPGAFQTTGKGGFAAKLDSAGANLSYSARFGDRSSCTAIAVDAAGNAFVTGSAGSEDFPATPGAFQTTRRAGDAFVARLDRSGRSLVYGTYLGSAGGVNGTGIALDPAGNAYVTGTTNGAGFPVTAGAVRLTFGGGICGYLQTRPVPTPIPCTDAFVTVLNAAGSGLLYSTYLGGASDDRTTDIAVAATGHFYVIGGAFSPDFPITPGAFKTTGSGGVFITKFGPGGDPRAVTSVSAASYLGPEIARAAIVAAFGSSLATSLQAATATPLPTSLAGTAVQVRDSAGVEHAAPLFFVSPTQVNYQLPSSAAAGAAMVTVTSGAQVVSTGDVRIVQTAPGVFAANANGQGVAAAVAVRVKPDGSQSYESIARYDQSSRLFVSIPIDLGPEGDQIILSLFGTGWRYRSAESAVKVTIGGPSGSVDAPVTYAGLQPTLTGLDQINVRLPRTLIGRGEADVVVTVDGKTANAVRASIK